MQGSRDDLSTNGGFQTQTSMKHATSVDTSFSKDVLNSIAGIQDLLRILVFTIHQCLHCIPWRFLSIIHMHNIPGKVHHAV